MDWPQIISFTLIAIVLEVSPGANFALITKSVATGGRPAALANIPGFSAAFLVQGSLSIFGVAAVLAASPGLLIVMQLVGALYLLYLGVQSFSPLNKALCPTEGIKASGCLATSTESGSQLVPGSAPSASKGFTDGFITTCLNPKISLFYYAVFPQITAGADNQVMTSFFLVLIHITVSAVWFSIVAISLSQLLRSANSGKLMQALRKCSGAALVGFSLYFAIGVAQAV